MEWVFFFILTVTVLWDVNLITLILMSCLCGGHSLIHFQHKVFFLKQGFSVTPFKIMLFLSARKVFLRLREKATVEGHKPDFRTCVINNTAGFFTRSSCRIHKPPGLLRKPSVLGHFVAAAVKDIVNTWRLVLASIHSRLKQSKKNQSWRKHHGWKRLQHESIHRITHLHMCDSVSL